MTKIADKYIFTLFLFGFLLWTTNAFSGKISMSTYYPAPYGSYDRSNLNPQSFILSASCQIGRLAVNSSNGNLYFCRNSGSGSGIWGPLDTTWTQTVNNIYPFSTLPSTPSGCIPQVFPGYSGMPICSTSPMCVPCISGHGIECPDVLLPEWCYCAMCEAGPTYDTIKIAIGTSTPILKLTLENDGGILAMGTFGSGATYPGIDCTDPSFTCPIPTLHWSPRKASFHAGGLTTTGTSTANYDYSVGFGMIPLMDDSLVISSGTTAGTSAGYNNASLGNYATIAGGENNSTAADYATILGGSGNVITSNAQYSFVTGYSNSSDGPHQTVTGQQNMAMSGDGHTIAGGGQNIINAATGNSTIGGGQSNVITENTGENSAESVITGGSGNSITDGLGATIGGGRLNSANSSYSFIGGGYNNRIGAVNGLGAQTQLYGVIGGGYQNVLTGNSATILGGWSNNASADYSTILGGQSNVASGYASLIGGGSSNTASGSYSVIVGGDHNTAAGDYSWVAGRYMNLSSAADRTFVWGYSDTVVNITAPDSFIIAPGTNSGAPVNPKLGVYEVNPSAIMGITLPSGSLTDYLAVTSTSAASVGNIFIVKNSGASDNSVRIGIGNNNPSYPLQVGNIAGPQGILTSGGVWTVPSSRAYKENIKPLDPQKAVETLRGLEPVHYTYKSDLNEHHVGFIAEDVPELIAQEGRKGLEPMNLAAVLTAVLKKQKNDIEKQNEILKNIESEIEAIKNNAKLE